MQNLSRLHDVAADSGKTARSVDGSGHSGLEVLDIMRLTPRHIFLDEALAHRAYEDVALPIGHNQTISQPCVVARMSEAIVKTGTMNRVLEIGPARIPNCGHCSTCQKVFTVERIGAV